MIRKVKHLDIINNKDDSFGTHPNLVVREDDDYNGYTITHTEIHAQYPRVKIEERDCVYSTPKFRPYKSYLTTHKNKLDENRKYEVLNKGKETLITRFLKQLIS